ncbi:hypothetical protein [Streptomyces sp. NBC_00986]|uniref:hypothetical protein n=1 Tax=Streptomyces sp. NBC_00986 TaxID=2903702 RepID=UPI0038674950|nr:hypothetical protein OG504_34585 [Streptomyces sp. NBC_00986]
MAEPAPINRRFDEDVHFNLVSPGPPRYRTRTDKPVRYFTVVDKQNGAVLGYVWGGDEDDAAAYVPRRAAGPVGANESISWISRLREAKARGIRPSQAVAEFLAGPEPGGRGRPLPGSLTDAPNTAAVKAVAQEA